MNNLQRRAISVSAYTNAIKDRIICCCAYGKAYRETVGEFLMAKKGDKSVGLKSPVRFAKNPIANTNSYTAWLYDTVVIEPQGFAIGGGHRGVVFFNNESEADGAEVTNLPLRNELTGVNSFAVHGLDVRVWKPESIEDEKMLRNGVLVFRINGIDIPDPIPLEFVTTTISSFGKIERIGKNSLDFGDRNLITIDPGDRFEGIIKFKKGTRFEKEMLVRFILWGERLRPLRLPGGPGDA